MKQFEQLEINQFYHIYNRGINGCNLFEENGNFEYFINLYQKYINPIAETYAWVLMPNHFHFLVKIKDSSELADNPDLTGLRNLSGLNKPPHQYFSNLFNAYTKAFNKHYERHGSLFERPFKRKLITHPDYLMRVLIYIHHNPVHHGFCSHPIQYGWSSYISCTSDKPTKLMRNELMKWFGDKNNFVSLHENKPDIEEMDSWLGI